MIHAIWTESVAFGLASTIPSNQLEIIQRTADIIEASDTASLWNAVSLVTVTAVKSRHRTGDEFHVSSAFATSSKNTTN
jgi:hypothetical protein